MSVLFVSSSLIGAAHAEALFGNDADGDLPLKPGAQVEQNAEAKMDAGVTAKKDMVGDADGDVPLTLEQQAETNAEVKMDAAKDATQGSTLAGDADGDQPTNQPIIDTDES
ncbi:hypothetical protein FMN50_02720 [Rhodobacterales bacterium]|nr:hypothetical protein FMN50_02720 [Rhodobacterales bacterium]